MIIVPLLAVAIICGTFFAAFVLHFRNEKELEAMRTAREIGLAKVSAGAEELTKRVEKLAKDVKDLSTPERMQVVNELAKKFKMGLGVRD